MDLPTQHSHLPERAVKAIGQLVSERPLDEHKLWRIYSPGIQIIKGKL